MEEKINLVELLKDCPEGMELDCTVYDICTLETVFKGCLYPIQIQTPAGLIYLTKYGSMSENTHSKCIIFPKGKNSWQGFQRPFKDGDILTNEYGKPFILKAYLPKINNVLSYCGIDTSDNFQKSSNNWTFAKTVRLATEEEKAKLFQVIKDNGYRWNEETKTLEKLPQFKVGDWVVNIDEKVNQVVAIDDDGFTLDDGSHCNNAWNKLYRLWTIQDAKEGDVLTDHCDDYKNPLIFILKKFEKFDFGLVLKSDYSSYCFLTSSDKPRFKEGHFHHKHDIKPATKEQHDLLFSKMKEAGYKWNEKNKILTKLIVPKFKVGDVIQDKDLYKVKITEVYVEDGCYGYKSLITEEFGRISFKRESEWKLVPNKFDITTLKPFESRVLIRNRKTDKWRPAIFGYYTDESNYYVLGGSWWIYCIPYEGNEHLMGKKDDCNEFYQTWEV